jgi:cytochrome c peroxidase
MLNLNSNKSIVTILLLVITIIVTGLAIAWQNFHSQMQVPKNSLSYETLMISDEPIQPIPLKLDLDENKIILGEKLFKDPVLSKNRQFACVSCHNLKSGGVDGKDLAQGVNGELSSTNTLTVFNSGFNFRQHWTGEYKDLLEQVDAHLLDPKIMGGDWSEILGNVRKDPKYVRGFTQAYSDGITQENIRDAIATFEQSLYTPNSRFDRYLRGDTDALTEAEKEGYQIFKTYGCVTCHQGMNIGGNLFQKFGILGNYFVDRGQINQGDLGRFNVTGNPKDLYVFRVPSLRNVSLTEPYLHDGSAGSLEEAIVIMAQYQLRPISSEHIQLIVQFLNTLTGEYGGEPL